MVKLLFIAPDRINNQYLPNNIKSLILFINLLRCNGGKKKNKRKKKKPEVEIEEIDNNEIDKIDTETEIMETADTSTNQVDK